MGGYNDLQREATEIENKLNNADLQHQKISEKLYKDLINNGDKQIKNLIKQRDEWKNLQDSVERGGSKWREYQEQIDSIDGAINTM